MSDSQFASALLPRTSGLPAPVTVNPLAAANEAAQAAGNVYRVRGAQAEQAIGQILQQSTDANGNVDYNKAHTLAAQAGPVVQMGMQNMLINTSRLSGEQQQQGFDRNSAINNAAVAALNAPPGQRHEALLRLGQGLVQSGAISQDQLNRALLNFSSDEGVLTQQLENVRVSTLPAQQRQDWLYGTPTTVHQGSQTGFGVVSPRTGAYTPAGAPAPIYPTTQEQTTVTYVTDLDPKSPTYLQQIPVTERDKRLAAGAKPYEFGPVQSGLSNGRYPTVPPAVQSPNQGATYKEGQRAKNDKGNIIVFHNGEWVSK